MKQNNHTRRDVLKMLGLGSLAMTVPGASGVSAESRKPNVVLIFADDQGSIDLNCYGASDLHTPNLDRLAGRGTRFTQFYVAAPVCSPSRAALLTGRYPQRAGLATNTYGKRGMPAAQVTIAEMLKGAGYRTGLFGKWHLGDVPELSPNRQGFEEFYGHKVGCIDNYSHFFYWQGPNRHDLWRNDEEVWEDGEYFPDLVVRESLRFMSKNKDRPFFMYLPFNMPHYPLQGEPEYRTMYNDTEEPRKSYAAFVSTLDEKIGTVIDAIDNLGLRDDTIIIYLSDHGHSTEERTFGGGGSSGPYRGYKFTLWEGGVRVPCIVSWPGHIEEGAVRDQTAISFDWMPTIAHYCGVQLPDRPIDGQNIAPVIESADTQSPHDVLHWEIGKHWAVREGDWKLVFNGPETEDRGVRIAKESPFLSNLSEDVTETKNIAGAHPGVVQRLQGLHEKWVTEVTQQE
ncbi:sulfatase-like hydrolase/transferase [Candidatus Latescibacterota bacterium]